MGFLMSSMQQPPVAPQPGPSSYQPPREPNISARTLVAVVGVVFIIVISMVLILLFVSGGGSSNSPSGALSGFADGINDGDMKYAFDHTILKFMPNYDEMLSMYDNMSFAGLVNIEFTDVSVVSNSSMTVDQQEEAQDTIDEINMLLDIEIQDTAFVDYTMRMEYAGYSGAPMIEPGEMLCIKVDGHWYIAMLSFPSMFYP